MNWKNDLLYPMMGLILKSALWSISRFRLPQAEGTFPVEGLDGHVEILRDTWGIPHIYARSTRDVLFGQGFVHAQERLWQMDFTRRVVAGRLSEVLGKAGLPADHAMRMLSLRRAAEQEAVLFAGEEKILMDSYCRGINTWITHAIRRHKLPLEFMLLRYEPEPWQMVDVISWVKLMCWTLAANWQSEFYRGELIRQFGPEVVSQLEIDIPSAWAAILDMGEGISTGKVREALHRVTGAVAGDGVGSNNWVIHGSRTASGKPLLANDMHLEMTTPSVWFENHLSGGDLEVTGITMPGVPLIVSGHNRSIAWGYTDALPDTQDLYEEHLRKAEDGSWEYEFQGEWLKAEVRQEPIRVKGGETEVEEVITTRHGPIMNMLVRDAFPDAPPMALRWTALEA